ncbi:MAG TPA: ATP-binding protein, partial [Aggregatilineales bacterium]|nr:ATP-binding protein [Aggregatilineales bacterium]
MKKNISPDIYNRLEHIAQKQGISVDDVILSFLETRPQNEFEVFERITDAFLALDTDWQVIFLNTEAETILQRSRDDLLGKNIWAEFPESRPTSFYSQAHYAMQNQLPVIFIEFYEPLETWLEIHAYPSDKGLSVYFRDVTLRKNLELALQSALFELDMRVKERTVALEIANDSLHKEVIARKKVEEELQIALNAERELSQLRAYFVSMVSHEFRTPLTSIRTSTDLIKNYSHRMTEVQRLRHLEKIQAQVTHLANLLETTLLFGKSQSKGLELHFDETDFKEFCQRLIQDMQAIAGEKHFIRLQIDGDAFMYHIDKQLTNILISNLITNSVKYSPKGGDIWVRVKCTENLVQLVIQDSGIGIPPDDLNRLFEDFYRAKNVGTIGGTGLGLTLVKNIVDSYKGSIDIESTLNVGTTFTIRLPLCSGLMENI